MLLKREESSATDKCNTWGEKNGTLGETRETERERMKERAGCL